jgi:predicted  nucleic acid-binding Zn-ribbon protein
MEKLLQTDFTHNYLNQNLEDNDKGDDVLAGKINEKVIDMEWVTAIEDTLGYMEKAIDEQRRFIKETQEVYRIDKAKVINKDSVKHLSQHTNFIAKVEGDRVTPNKVLTVEREESFEIYENRFLITLIRLANQFVNDKYRKMVDAPTDTYNRIQMKRDLVLNNQKVTFNVEYSNEIKDNKADDLNIEDYESLSDFDRVRRIREKLNSFLNTPMMKEIANCIPVRPPILHTNLMMKNPNFKGCLDLYNYLNAYKKPGYEIVGKEYTGKMDKDVQESVYFSMGFQHFMMSISTNPALKNLLEERYEEENAKWEKEHSLPVEEQRRRELERIEEVRKEEMKIRLQEIREREKTIREQKSEIAALKREIEKRDKTIDSLKSTIRALEDEVKGLQNELQKVKVELVKAMERIAELEEKVKALEAKVAELEAKIAELEEIKAQLEAKVKELEEIKAQLEAKVKELEQIIEEQKAKIAELEGIVAQQKIRIAELEAMVAELERIKAELESKVDALEKENAEQKATIASQQETIAQQKANIATLEQEIATAKAEIATLTDTLAQRDNTIAQQSNTIDNLNNNIVNLQNDLDIERQAHSDDVEAEKQAHQSHVAELNSMFEAEKASIEQAHKTEIANNNTAFDKKVEKINSEHQAELQKLEKRCDSEKKQIQKTCDQRVKAAQKEAEKVANAKAKEEIAKAQKEARLSAKKAQEKANKAKADFKAERGIKGLFKYDYTVGALGMQTLKTLDLASKGVESNTILQELTRTRRMNCIYVVRDNKKISLATGGFNELSVVKTFKGESDFDVCKKQIADLLANADRSGVYITYKTMDKLYVNNLAQFVNAELGFEKAEVFHNKGQKSGCSTLGIYFYRG